MEPLPGHSAPEAAVGPARIADVAARAGVGVATVSRVLNQRGGVRPATRDRVVEAICRSSARWW
jgi:LacI family transcriptional regulator